MTRLFRYEYFARTRRMLHAWLATTDPKTLLLPDRIEGARYGSYPLYPHDSGADKHPYLILTAYLTDPEVYRGRMMEMLRSEIRYTEVPGGRLPSELRLDTHQPGRPVPSAPASTARTEWSRSPNCSAARPGITAWPI